MISLLIGLVFESIMVSLDLARYDHGQIFSAIAPLWIILMWPLFATTLNISMRWLKNLAPLLTALIGAVFAPLAYLAGERLGAVVYDNIILSIGVISIAWAVLLPVLATLSLKHDGYNDPNKQPGTREVTVNV